MIAYKTALYPPSKSLFQTLPPPSLPLSLSPPRPHRFLLVPVSKNCPGHLRHQGSRENSPAVKKSASLFYDADTPVHPHTRGGRGAIARHYRTACGFKLSGEIESEKGRQEGKTREAFLTELARKEGRGAEGRGAAGIMEPLNGGQGENREMWRNERLIFFGALKILGELFSVTAAVAKINLFFCRGIRFLGVGCCDCFLRLEFHGAVFGSYFESF